MPRILFAGDYCSQSMQDSLDAAAAQRILQQVQPVLRQADFRVINLENPIGPRDCGTPIVKSGPNLLGLPQNLALLKEGGFDCATLANNHLGDYGTQGVLSTLKYLRGEHIAFTGGGEDPEQAYEAWRVQKDGVSFSVLSVCENEFGMACPGHPGSAGFDAKRLQDSIAAEKQNCAFCIVVFHGGAEYAPVPSAFVAERYRLLIDWGADAVVAMHTHCMQGWEYYRGCPILYSLGNFWFPEEGKDAHSPWRYGCMAVLTLTAGEKIQFALHPYRQEDDCLHLFAGQEKQAILRYLEEISACLASDAQLTRLYKGWCRISGVQYAQHVFYDPAFETGCPAQELLALARVRNLFSCESHRELMLTTLQSMLDGSFVQAEDAQTELRRLQQMPV